MHGERVAEHLLDRVEGIDQRQVLDELAILEAQEMRQPIADHPAVVAAGGEPVQRGTTATVVRNTLATNALTVNLNSSPPGIVALPVSVPLPLNQTSATFTVTGILNGKQTGPESVTLTASATGFNSGAAPLTVSDIYLPDLSPASITVSTTALTSGQLISVQPG